MRWDGDDNGPITVYDFSKREEISIYPDQGLPQGSKMSAHGGADFFLVAAFVKAVSNNDPKLVRTGIKDSLRSHKLVFAAERSRKNNSIETVEI